MSFNRSTLILIAAATLTNGLLLQGRQDPPARPAPPVRDADTGSRPPAVGTAIIAGTVVVAGSGVAARRARVTLGSPDGGPPRNAVADQQGRFAFPALPAGRYTLSASKPGHIAGIFGQPRPGRSGTPIQLEDGQKFDARLQITRGGVLTGTLLDEDGDAVPGTLVRALRYVLQNGVRTLQPSGTGSTDDRGIYRIYGLQPGDYVVGAVPRNDRGGPNPEALREELMALRQRVAMSPRGEESGALAGRMAALQAAMANTPDESDTGYAPIYYPGSTSMAQAAPVTLGPGEERTGLDFQLQRVAVARVEGAVINSTGQPLQNMQVLLIDLAQAAPGIGTNATRAEGDGKFRFSNVPPGQYRISARAASGGRGGGRGMALRGEPGVNRFWASLDVTVEGRDLTNVLLSLQPGMSASGRLVFQGTAVAPPADLSRMRVSLVPMDPGPARELAAPAPGTVDASGKFTITGILPGRYRLTASGAPQGWTLESSVVDGQDSLDFPFEVKAGQNVGAGVITFTDQRSELTGALTDNRGQPAPAYTLILYPADQRYWTPQSRRIRTTRPATDGRFIFGTVPPGDYKIAPVVDVEPGAWFDPAFLQQLDTAAMRLSIAEGEKKVQNVRISGG